MLRVNHRGITDCRMTVFTNDHGQERGNDGMGSFLRMFHTGAATTWAGVAENGPALGVSTFLLAITGMDDRIAAL